MGVAFYTIGFATAVQTTFFPDASQPLWMIRGIGSAGLLFVLAISLTGAEFFAKFNVGFFGVSLLACMRSTPVANMVCRFNLERLLSL
jgi:amino acid transporter